MATTAAGIGDPLLLIFRLPDLLLVNQLCDLVKDRSPAHGIVARLHMGRG